MGPMGVCTYTVVDGHGEMVLEIPCDFMEFEGDTLKLYILRYSELDRPSSPRLIHARAGVVAASWREKP